MTNPTSGLDNVPVFGTYKNFDGTAKAGYVLFTVAERVVRTNGTVIYPQGQTIRANLDSNGSFSTSFPASDDPDVLPVGWQVHVREVFNDGTGQEFLISTPLASLPTGINLGLVAVPPDAPTVVGPVYQKGMAGGVAALDADGDVVDASGVKVATASIPDFTNTVKGIVGATVAETATIDPTYDAGTLSLDIKNGSITAAKVAADVATQAELNVALAQIAQIQAQLAASTPKPVAAFSASVTSGIVPFTVDFTDASGNNPTTWEWSFADGPTSSAQNPSHTFTSAGTYTVTLTVTNAGGSDTATGTITASAPTGTGSVTYPLTATTASSSTAVTDVVLTKPTGMQGGDVMVAQIVSDGAPTLTTVPAGWTLAVPDDMAPNGSPTTRVYYKVVSGAVGVAESTEPASYTWVQSIAKRFGAGIAVFRGCDTTTPWDGDAVYFNQTASATTIVSPAITTVTPNGMLVRGIGLNSTSATATVPAGFSEKFEVTGGRTSELSTQAQTTAGTFGPHSSTLSLTQTGSVWTRALRRSGATPPATGPKLTWAPPTLDSNYIDLTVVQGDRVLMLDPTRDYRIHMPSSPLIVTSDFQIVGGKNVVLIGGEVRCTQAGRQFLIQNHASTNVNGRTVHVEGLKFSVNPGVQMTEGININCQDDTGNVVRLQNMVMAPIWGLPAYHADIIQAYNGPYQLDVDLFEGSSNYQGFMVQPHNSGNDTSYAAWTWKRLRVEMRNDRTDGGDAGYVVLTTNTPYPTVSFTDFQITGAGASSSRLTVGSTSGSPPANSTTGMSVVGSFTGDRATCGVGYVSPGYL